MWPSWTEPDNALSNCQLTLAQPIAGSFYTTHPCRCVYSHTGYRWMYLRSIMCMYWPTMHVLSFVLHLVSVVEHVTQSSELGILVASSSRYNPTVYTP